MEGVVRGVCRKYDTVLCDGDRYSSYSTLDSRVYTISKRPESRV